MRRSSPRRRLRLREAVALGALQGPTELLPVSSSAHIELVPLLLGWGYAELDADLRKAFEVAVHAGTAAALLIVLREEVVEAAAGLDRRRIVLLAGSFAPPALVGYVLEGPIEERLGTARPIAIGLLAGAAAMVLADTVGNGARSREDAGAVDALALGAAQTCALMPGVSRNGATLTAARMRGFSRADAGALSRHAALPIIGGATVLKSMRLARHDLPPGTARAFAAGIAAAFLSTLASKRLVRDDRALWPYAVYRAGLALAVLSSPGSYPP